MEHRKGKGGGKGEIGKWEGRRLIGRGRTGVDIILYRRKGERREVEKRKGKPKKGGKENEKNKNRREERREQVSCGGGGGRNQ